MKTAWIGSSRAILLATAIIAFAGLALGQQFKYSNIWIPGSAGLTANAINDLGVVVGWYQATVGGPEHGFMINGKDVTTIDYPGGERTICYGINNSGQVVGAYFDTEALSHAFLCNNGVYSNIDPPGIQGAGATGINNLGQIVGSYVSWPNQFAFLFDGTSYQTLRVNAAVYTVALGINDSGQVTVQWGDPNGYVHSSIYKGATYTEIQILGAQDIYAFGINDEGNIAIVWYGQDIGVDQGALRVQDPEGGYVYPLIEDPSQSEAGSTRPYGVNNKGIIVGTYMNSKAQLGFWATGVPQRR